MTIIAQISDTHFGTEVPEVVQALETYLAKLTPDVVILSGDITQRARRTQFEAASAFMQRLSGTVKLVIPGNHDIPLFNIAARIFSPYQNYKRAFGTNETLWGTHGLAIVGFDATSPLRHTRGFLRDKQIARHIAKARELAGPNGVILACAHQPLATALSEDHDNILIRGMRTADILSGHHVDVVLSGHVHMPLIETTRRAYPNLSHHFILSGAGTAISRRTRPGAPNSFNVITVEPGGGAIGVALVEYQAANATFEPKAEHRFTRSNRGWE